MFRFIFFVFVFVGFQGHGQFVDLKKNSRWSYEAKYQKIKYLNGKTKSEGNYGIYTTEKGLIILPVGRHIHYRRNGKIREIENFSSSGLHVCDSIFAKDGRVKTVVVYEKPGKP